MRPPGSRCSGRSRSGNIHSLAGEYGFDPATNRAVAVHSDALLEALSKIYGAQRIVDELAPAPRTAAPAGRAKGRSGG